MLTITLSYLFSFKGKDKHMFNSCPCSLFLFQNKYTSLFFSVKELQQLNVAENKHLNITLY